MTNVYLEWPEGVKEPIVAELVSMLRIGEEDAADAVDLVAAHVVAAIGADVLRVAPGRSPRNVVTGPVTGSVVQAGDIRGGLHL